MYGSAEWMVWIEVQIKCRVVRIEIGLTRKVTFIATNLVIKAALDDGTVNSSSVNDYK